MSVSPAEFACLIADRFPAGSYYPQLGRYLHANAVLAKDEAVVNFTLIDPDGGPVQRYGLVVFDTTDAVQVGAVRLVEGGIVGSTDATLPVAS